MHLRRRMHLPGKARSRTRQGRREFGAHPVIGGVHALHGHSHRLMRIRAPADVSTSIYVKGTGAFFPATAVPLISIFHRGY